MPTLPNTINWATLGITPKASIPAFTGLCLDSRRCQPGDLFIAIPGNKVDGSQYIHDAIAKGAVAVLTEPHVSLPDLTIPVLHSSHIRQSLALLAGTFYQPQPAHIVAVTGTNGKTSTVTLCQQLWQAVGIQAASIGTLGILTPRGLSTGSLTTPDPVVLHQQLQTLCVKDIQHVALEASSHGIEQHRLDGVVLEAAAFTNLSRDHLDYHHTMQAYFAAKAQLFNRLLPMGKTAILNKAIDEFDALQAICTSRQQRIISFGTDHADLALLDVQAHHSGLSLNLSLFGARHQVLLPLYGLFQAQNLLAAFGLLLATNTPVAALLAALPDIKGIPGRMEKMTGNDQGFHVFVDYAHTPDALHSALVALRPHTKGNLIIVFGCGGDRDAGKRPMMGATACTFADQVIITDDNPRTEDAASIRQQIVSGCPFGKSVQNIGSRELAIATALDAARPGDTILVAGKGHEQGQIIGTDVIPYSDQDTIRKLLP